MKLEQAPEQGIMYALYKDRMIFEPYKKEELPKEDELKKNLLELHLFDGEKEYRFIKTRKGEIEKETICDSQVPHDDRYIEKIFVSKERNECIEVVNYITYDEDDLMAIRNYRLREVTR